MSRTDVSRRSANAALRGLLCVAALAGTTAAAAEAVEASPPAEYGIRDPYFQEVLYYGSMSDPLSALARLQAARRQHRLQMDLGAIDLELGRLYGEYNMPQMSADSYARVMGRGTSATLRSEAAYRLAQYYYRRGDYTRASSALLQASTGLPYELESQKPFFKSLILMADGRNAEATKLFADWKTPLKYDSYTRYNLGVANLRMGNLLVGAGFLDSVGVMKAGSEEELSLRDQANLALGYGFLRADQGATARPLLKRVRLDGAYSNRALLGAGWAELAPDGTRQQNLYLSPIGCKEDPIHMLPAVPILHRPARDPCDPEKTFKQRVNFESTPGGKSEEERLRKALTPWLALVQRSPAGDPAVQEALLAVPYAYSRLNSRDETLRHYRQAVAAYEQEHAALERLMETVRSGPINTSAKLSGKNISWQTAIWNLPRAEDALYMEDALAGYRLQAALEDYRDLQQLKQNLAESSARLQTVAQVIRDAGAADAAQAAAEPQIPLAPQPPAEESPRPILDYGLDNNVLLGTAAPPRIDMTAEDKSAVSRRRTENLNGRYQSLQASLQTLQSGTRSALAAQEQAVRDLALADLDKHRQRLETYMARARIALARLLDPALEPDGQ